MPPQEPTLDTLPHPLQRYLHAVRPGFLNVSLVGVLIGLATAWSTTGHLNVLTAGLTLIGALLAQAGVNVLNDYYDDLNGTDRCNRERLFPFTGGSRSIQNGLLSAEQTRNYGIGLVGAVILIGLLLLLESGSGLFWIGLAGLLLGWAYSAPPIALVSRGLGEIAVAIGFGVIIPLGADFVQRGDWSLAPVLLGAPFALLVAAILFINEFPDYHADRAAGKANLVVRLGRRNASRLYPLFTGGAYLILILDVLLAGQSAVLLIALLPALLNGFAMRELFAHHDDPAHLEPAIKATIGAAVLHGTLVAALLAIVG